MELKAMGVEQTRANTMSLDCESLDYRLESDQWLSLLPLLFPDQEPEGHATFSGVWADLHNTSGPASGGEDSARGGEDSVRWEELPQALDPVR